MLWLYIDSKPAFRPAVTLVAAASLHHSPGCSDGFPPAVLFNSLTFVAFFATVVSTYWLLPGWTARKNLLLIASYVFYGAWNPPFAALLFATTALDFYLGARIAGAGSPASRKAWMITSVMVNLSMLGFFKYGNFLLENTQLLLSQIGIQYQPPHMDVFLPVGISFYTFHSLSYTLDVYRGVCAPTRSLRDFALAVSFFPQLVAGPIVRAADFLPQLESARVLKRQQFAWGLFLMTLGMWEKIVLADALLATSADAVFGFNGPLRPLDAWAGVFAFSGQIFFDFAGYSTCAIGAALCLGFHLKDNFLFPYAATGFSDFWRRWHISLSTFLRDFVYIPLGGNRVGAPRALLNLVIVMFVGGLWHGAAWTFVVWGLLHGLLLAAERILQAWFGKAAWTETSVGKTFLAALTFVIVSVIWIFFRSTSFAGAGGMIGALLGLTPPTDPVLTTRELLQVLLVVGGLFAAHRLLRDTRIETVLGRAPQGVVVVIWTLFLCSIILTQGSGHAFIYFQF